MLKGRLVSCADGLEDGFPEFREKTRPPKRRDRFRSGQVAMVCREPYATRGRNNRWRTSTEPLNGRQTRLTALTRPTPGAAAAGQILRKSRRRYIQSRISHSTKSTPAPKRNG